MTATRTALVIGGTGPTGPGVVKGLLDRGFDVTILHGGQHEAGLPEEVPHIHVDPHFAETLAPALGARSFDLVVVQYGRLQMIADLLRGRTGRLIAIGGATGSLAAAGDPLWGRVGRPAIVTEDQEHLEHDIDRNKFGLRMAEAEQAVLASHGAGDYEATYLAYPIVYGPRVLVPHEWAIIRRLQDGRRQLIVADGGIKVETRLYVDNAVAAVLAALDGWERAKGEKFVIADTDAFSMSQRIAFVAEHLGIDVELVDVPYPAAGPCHAYWRHVRENRIRPNEKSRHVLGYQDAVSAHDALARTVDWIAANPPQPGGEEESRLQDPFDYEDEDRIIREWLDFSRQGGSEAGGRAAHPYRHPKRPGEAWQAPTP
jgi:nucleoside-diphosphate-sugar epimerase